METLITQVKDKFEGFLEDFWAREAYPSKINVDKDRIVVNYKIFGDEYTLGWFSNS